MYSLTLPREGTWWVGAGPDSVSPGSADPQGLALVGTSEPGLAGPCMTTQAGEGAAQDSCSAFLNTSKSSGFVCGSS